MSDKTTGATYLNSGNFDQTLKEAQNKPVLVDFYATWCGPCKMAAPIIDELSLEYQGKAIIAKVDVDENQEIASQYGVMSIPTVVIFKNGKEVNRQTGFAGKEGYNKMLKEAME